MNTYKYTYNEKEDCFVVIEEPSNKVLKLHFTMDNSMDEENKKKSIFDIFKKKPKKDFVLKATEQNPNFTPDEVEEITKIVRSNSDIAFYENLYKNAYWSLSHGTQHNLSGNGDIPIVVAAAIATKASGKGVARFYEK